MAKKSPRSDLPLSESAQAFQSLYSADKTRVRCEVCGDRQYNIQEHLRIDHPQISLESYREQFPNAPLAGPNTPGDIDPEITVTAKEAAAHPCGREGAQIEKMLDRAERRSYREDIEALLLAPPAGEGFMKGPQVASLAYLMVLARRTRLDIEKTRRKGKGELFASEALKLLDSLESRIGGTRRELENQLKSRTKPEDDPMQIVESEMAAAERYVRTHIGELTQSCPACNIPITLPGLPHWVFAPIKTKKGVEYAVWSPELWMLVMKGLIPLHFMAFALRISPEGIKMTAARRGIQWPEGFVLEAAEQSLRVLLQEKDAEALEPVEEGILPPMPDELEEPETADVEITFGGDQGNSPPTEGAL